MTSFIQYVRTKTILIFLLIVGGTAMTYFVCDSCTESFYKYFIVSAFVVSIWVSMWLGNEYISHIMDEKFSWTKELTKRLSYGIISVILYTVIAASLLILLFENVFHLDVGGTSQLYGTVTIAVGITFIMTSRSFLFKWKESAIHAEKLQKESIAAKYESLKSQVSPHFLFNSLNALSNLVYEDQEKAVKFIKQLSEVYRYVLDTREKEVVRIDEELKFLNSYIFLQRIRFGNKLDIQIKLTDEKSFVAPLALQMLIENAIKHNEISEDNPLHIKVFKDGDYIVVENDLLRKTTLGEPSSGIGLENISKRYELLSNKKVEIIQNADLFIVKLPLITES